MIERIRAISDPDDFRRRTGVCGSLFQRGLAHIAQCVVQRSRLGQRSDPQFILQYVNAARIQAQRCASFAKRGMGAHQQTVRLFLGLINLDYSPSQTDCFVHSAFFEEQRSQAECTLDEH
jgi:hypothetical protein